jgi:Bacterial membrane protein YfhO
MARGSQATWPARSSGRRMPGGGGGRLVRQLRSAAPTRYLVAHPDLAAALLLALFVLVYLWPALLRGELLSPISALYDFAPWQRLAPPDLHAFSNGLLSDVPTADYPWRFLIRQMLHDGTFPSWNPYVLDGISLWSNPQTGLFSIFSLPLWILPLNYGIGVGAALKLWAAGFGSYLLVRQLRLGFLPGLLAGVCFSLSAIDVVWLTHETIPAVAALLPWTLWLVERIYQGGRLGTLLGLAVAAAIGLGGGHPGMQVHLMAAAATYALLRALFLPRGTPARERLLPLGLAFGGLALGALLMSVMLLPEALSSRGTIGTVARSHGRGTLPGTQMPFTTIRTVLFPDWWGRPSGYEGGHTRPVTQLAPGVFVGVNYNERTFYAGTIGLLFALVGVAASGGWRRKGPFVVLGVLALAITLHTPGLYQLVTHLPAFDQVQNQRVHFVWAMGLSVMAAFGLHALLERPAADRRRLLVGGLGMALGIVMLVVAGAGASTRAIHRTVTHFLTGEDFHSDAVLPLTSAVWYLLFALAVLAALLSAWRWPRRRAWIASAVVVVAALDMLHFAGNYQPIAPASKSIPPATGAIRFLERHRDQGRIVGIGQALQNDWALTYGLRDIRGYDPPQPSERYFGLWKLAEAEQLNWTPFAVESLSPTALQVASALGARYVVAEPGATLEEGSDPAVRALRVAYDGSDARVFLNPRAAPRAMVAPSVRVVDGEAGAQAALTEAGFDPRREVVVERGETGGAMTAVLAGASAGTASGTPGRVSVSDPSNARVLMRAVLSRPGLVVLNDSLTPGWTVRVDGRAGRPVRVNDVMRGVAVPTGSHEVEWSYRVPGLRAGTALTLLALVGLLAGLVLPFVRRRRRAAPAR